MFDREHGEPLALVDGTTAELLTHYLFKWHYFEPDLDEYREWWAERRGRGY